jgi:tRNA uridine 5-carboxymethylaminomethyl modification enzyme
MLTARAEYRLRLRANNASTRLTPLALDVGAVGIERAVWFRHRAATRDEAVTALQRPASAAELQRQGLLAKLDLGVMPLWDWLRYDGIELSSVAGMLPDVSPLPDDVLAELSEDAEYAPYVARQEQELRELRASETLALPDAFSYAEVPGLSREMVERLSAARPASLGAAGRIPGMTPAGLAALMVHARRTVAA